MRGLTVLFLSSLFVSQITAQTQTDVIAASQLGFAPNSKKQFSSPIQFASFAVKRVSDNAVVYTGGASLRSITDAIIGGATVWMGDFSALTTSGRYKIVVGGTESYPFDIRNDVFDQATRATQRFFYFQRAFTAIEQPYAEGPWTHPSDAFKAPAGVVKGWHDAGDLTVYNATMTQALFWLLETWSDFRPLADNTNIPESRNGIPDILDEARWGVEWLLSMQEPTGGAWACATAGNGTNIYPYGSTFPHTVAPYVKSAAPSTQVTAKTVAILGYASGVFRPFDAVFADRCLEAARRGWSWMAANPNQTYDGVAWGTGNTFNMYAQGGDQALLKTNKMWAAAGMLYATGEAQFESAFQTYFESIGWISSFAKSEAFAASLYLRVPAANPATKTSIKQRIFQMADGVRSEANAHPYQFATYYYWGCTSNAMHRTGQFSWRAYLLDSTRTADRDQGLANLDYIFGRNFLNQVYLSGVDGVSKPRQRGFHQWMKALNASTWHFPGALAGGPNQSPDGNDYSYPNNQPYPTWGYWGDPSNPRGGSTPVDARFTDNDSWCTNEVVVSWNAALLYNLYAAKYVIAASSPTAVGTTTSTPKEFTLGQNFPNPFNPSTTIEYSVPRTSHVNLTIYNLLGQRVRTLVDREMNQGSHPVQWDGTDDNHSQLPSGMYVYRMQAGEFTATQKLILSK
jgi:endoglucanase